ncbi:glycosyltransferase family 39 protein, partial [Thermoflexus hugenholtzii]
MLRERGFWLMIPGLLLVTSPLWWAGFPPSHDGVLHVYRVLEMHRMWRAGVFFPRWAPDLVDGLGYPLFHFLGPLFPWLGALGMTLGLDLESSVKVVLALLTLLGSAGVYRLARRWGIGEGGAMAAGLAYAFAPFRVRELYWQGDFPQYLGLCLLPWTLDTFHNYLRAGGWARWWKAGLTYALLL